ncbi:MAG: VCBS repeat-containing protein [Draconibacterium sp.]|nr:VCBS repeat-containing protein [Draconibacterium sp.]
MKTNFSINSPFCVGAYGVDFNNDGLFDVFIRSASGINTMFRNDGNRNFTLVSTYNTGRDIGVNFNDYDGDGIQDLTYTKNGWADGQWGFRFNKGLGDGNFSSSTLISNSQQRPVDDFIQLQANPKINSIPDVIYNCMNDGSNGAILYQGEWNSSSSSFDITTWNSNLTGQVTLINTIDINFDGYSDLVFDQQNGSEPNLTHTSVVFLNNGEGIFTISDEIFTDKTYALRAVFNDGQDHIKMATWKSDSLFVFNLDQYKKLDLNSGLLAYYPFNGNANDESGNENNGVVEGQTSFQPGKVGMAANFRGKSVGDYISVPQNNVNSLSEITVSNWVYVNDYDLNCWNSAEGFITRGDPNANNFFSFGVLRNEEPNCGAASSLDSIGFRLIFSNSVYLDTKKSYKPNVWYHVVGTYDGKNLRIYVDNQPAAESPEITGIQLIGNSRLLINKHEIYSNGRMGGLIDELRLYNRALNLSEIDSLYKQGVSINQPPTANAGPDGDVWIVYPETQKTVYLDGSASVDPDGDELTYRWTAPEGVILSSNSIAMPSFVANFENSPYTFSLIVNDGKQDSPADLVVIRAIQVIRANSPTVAKAGPDQVVTGGTVVTLDGSASFDYDEDGYPNPLTYSWTAPEGITLSSTTSIKPTFTAPNVASTTSLFFTLQVSDGGSSNTDTVVVTLLGNDILGISVVYGLASTAANRRAIPVTFNENGEINSISVYHNGGSGNMLLGVYADGQGNLHHGWE